MGIINRTLDSSEQHKLVTAPLGALAVSETHVIYVAPYPVTLKQVKVAALGLSGAPTQKLTVNRFVVGAGATVIADIQAAIAIPAIGTSGLFGLPSLPAAGSTLLNLQAGDYLTITTAGSNTAMTDCLYELTVQALQDTVSWFGTSY
jgi:hypothetical protein